MKNLTKVNWPDVSFKLFYFKVNTHISNATAVLVTLKSFFDWWLWKFAFIQLGQTKLQTMYNIAIKIELPSDYMLQP